MNNNLNGILLLNKPSQVTSFSLVSLLRRLVKIQKIGHAGTLDPFATGLMVMLIGKKATSMSHHLLNADKEYLGTVHLGIVTDTYDPEGKITSQSDQVPSLLDIEQALCSFRGKILQTPPMFSAKKIGGQKLCDLARKGIVVERSQVPVEVQITLLSYSYPFLELQIQCSKGTYIRSLAHDLGALLGCGAHLSKLIRTRSGAFSLQDAIDPSSLQGLSIEDHLRPV